MPPERPESGRCSLGDCTGSRGQHAGDEGCWGPCCESKPEIARCHRWTPGPARRPSKVALRAAARETEKKAAAVARLRAGTKRKTVFDLIRGAGDAGRTDDELESITGWSHQTVSARRNGLMNDGLIVDSGFRRQTRQSVAATVWVVPLD